MKRIHIEHQGTRAAAVCLPLVLLHGWGLNLRVFDPLVAALGPAQPTLAVDLPGHGRSIALDWPHFARDLLDELPQRFALLGWSLGGQIALSLAHSAPDRVARLVLISSTPRFEAAPDWAHGLAPDVVEKFARELGSDYRRTVADFLGLQVRGSVRADAALTTLRNALLAHGEAKAVALAAGLALLRSNDLRTVLPQITAPTLIVSGQYDRVTPPAAARELACLIPQARHVELRRAGHVPFVSHPDECAAAIQGFLSHG